MTKKETPRQAKVRRMAARFAERHGMPGLWLGSADGDRLRAFGLEVWAAARREARREGALHYRSRAHVVQAIRRAGH